jgi:histidinol-phosphate aminotransferase
MSSRRHFLGAATVGAAALAFPPVFSRSRLFAAAPLAGGSDSVHLNYNESPYGPSEKTVQAIREALDDAIDSCGRYYGDSDYDALRALLAKHHGLKAENILLGAGSIEILKLCDDVFLRKPRLVAAAPVYDAVIGYAVNSRAPAVKVPLTADFRHDLPRMAEAATRDTGMIYICNPNNPTGTIVTKDEMDRFFGQIPESLPVVVDEAYSHFVAAAGFESAVRYVKEGRNVVVARTFSKIYGLAGMRVGYAIAKKELIDELKPRGVHFAIGSVAAQAAATALLDHAHVERVARLNREQLQALDDEMKRAKFEVIPSQANFAMIHIRRPVAPVIAEFAKRKILVGREFPPMSEHLRVTMGTEIEMKRFFMGFREIVGPA